ncbi:MalY/PatB family protein [Allobranchiibius sp. GilTou73]|uniref:MalY/PatB family protein n=1 Tax=Allobranchiibius sp. GilTou73 TaxID=2904523 RepID=UPI001F17F266|nr:aminotransferase class I/II-fold pyridoxal phosphate-dependent enzyme [Allobranchiibius sp. GilTou73]UIJ34940.1 aminotransferase class I/II-fold pyridoxal phosphate-dependent enzyme [Allobranchiibius sp. GilTou73]
MAILDASLDELRATRTSIKWRAYDLDVIPVWVAEMDCAPCDPVVEAIEGALRRGDVGYAAPGPLEEAFAHFAKERWDWAVDPAQAMMLPDVMIGVGELLRANTRPDAAVVVSPPCYDAFFGFVQAVGRRLVTARLDANSRLDPEALEAAFRDAGPGAAYILCNPQNPMGTVHTADELAMLARLADRYDVQVVSDEIHGPLTHPGVTYTPYLAVPEASRGISVVSGSKSWNLAGLKIALAVPGADATASLGALHEVNTHGANHLAEIAHTAAYAHGGPWLDELRGEIVERRELLWGMLAEQLPEIRVTPGESTYLVWLDCTELGLADPARSFLQQGRVALGVGTNYDPRGRQFVRFNVATSPQVIGQAVERMAGVLH